MGEHTATVPLTLDKAESDLEMRTKRKQLKFSFKPELVYISLSIPGSLVSELFSDFSGCFQMPTQNGMVGKDSM